MTWYRILIFLNAVVKADCLEIWSESLGIVNNLLQSLTHCIHFFNVLFWWEGGCRCDGLIALDPSARQVSGATARLMSVAGNWQMEASISPLIRGSRSPPTDRVQLGNVVAASSHPARFIKRSLIPRHNIINFVSGWTQWTSNLINFYHWMLEGRVNEINAQYFPARQPTLRAVWIVGGSGVAMVPDYYALFRPIHKIFLKGNKISGFEINHERALLCILGDFRIMKWKGRTAAQEARRRPGPGISRIYAASAIFLK